MHNRLALVIVGLLLFSVQDSLGQPKARELHPISLKSREFKPDNPVSLSSFLRAGVAGEGRVHALIQLNSMPDSNMEQVLRKNGVVLLEYIPNQTWVASIPRKPADLQSLESLVAWSGAFLPDDKIAPYLLQALSSEPAEDPENVIALKVFFFEDATREQIMGALSNLDAGFTEDAVTMSELDIAIKRKNLTKLAAEDCVRWIEGAPPLAFPELSRAQLNVQANGIEAAPYSLTGAGVNVGIFEFNHAWVSHPALTGRLVKGNAAEANDYGRHTTMVAGTIGGNGTKPAGRCPSADWAGMAIGVSMATYDFDSNNDNRIENAQLYADMDLALNGGTRVINNSWGFQGCSSAAPYYSYPYGQYVSYCRLFDGLVNGDNLATGTHRNPVVVVFSAGNERMGVGGDTSDQTCIANKSAPYANYGTLNAPKAAKNVIVVGAIDALDNKMTGYSSWGPTADGRLGVTLVASGSYACPLHAGIRSVIDSTEMNYGTPDCYVNGMSFRAADYRTDFDGYGWFAMTSCGAAVASGCIADLMQDLNNRYPTFRPLPSTIKALLVHSAMDLSDATSWYNPGPDYASGYGLLQLKAAVDLARAGNFTENRIGNAEEKTFYITVPAGATSVKVTLAWDDPPAAENAAKALINDLNLSVIDDAGLEHHPWVLDPSNPSADATRPTGSYPDGVDHVNNLEQVVIDLPAPSAGAVFRAVVKGYSVPSGPQRFSLVGQGVADTFQFLGSYDTPGTAYDIKLIGTSLFVADGSSGLQILNVSQPTSIALRGSYDTAGISYGLDVVRSGRLPNIYTYAFIADGLNGLEVLDASTPTRITEADHVLVENESATDIKVLSGKVYAAITSRLGWVGLAVFAADSLGNLQLADHYETTVAPRGIDIVATTRGARIYLAEGSAGLEIVDYTPGELVPFVHRGGVNTPGTANAVYVVGTKAYVADGTYGLQIVDVTSPTSPSIVGAYDTPGDGKGVFVTDDVAYIADGVAGLQVLDVGTPSAVALLYSYDTPGSAEKVYASGSRIYIADGTAGIEVLGIRSLAVSPASLTASCAQGANPASQTFQVWNEGDTALTYQVSESLAWLSVSPASGALSTTPGVLTVTFNAASLAPGTYSGYITITPHPDIGSAKSVYVTLSVAGPPATLTVASVNPSTGVPITVTPNDNNNQGNGVTLFTRTYAYNTTVTLTAPATFGTATFQKWQKDGTDFSTSATANVTMDGAHTMTAIYTGGLSLADALDGTGLTWTTGGNTPWFAETTTTHDGVDAAQSGALGNSQNNWIQTTVTGPGTLTFWWKVSSEAGYDFARFFINGVEQARRSGEGAWVQASYTLGAGAQTLRWDYIKDPGVAAGSDAAWVDQVSFVPGAVLTLADALDGTGLTWTTGGNTPWFAETTTTHDGVDAAQSGALGNSQNNWIQTTVTGPGTLTFWWKVSSEAGYDFARFFINGVQQASRSGEGNWVQASYTLGAGAQTLRWDYIKDPGAIGGLDAAWVDQVNFVPGAGVTLTVNSVNPASGVAITVSPNDSNGQGNGTTSFTRTYAVNTLVTLTAPATAGANTFQKWQKDGLDVATTLSTTVTMGAAHTMTAVYLVPTLTLADALDGTGLTWTTGGNTPWFPETTTTHDGVDAAQSGALGNSQNNWIQTIVAGPGTLTFWWKVSSEAGYDYARFFINGVEQARRSGEGAWVQATYNLPAGSQTLRWDYIKDPGVAAGSDAAWVDQVSFVPGAALTLADALDGTGLTWTTGGNTPWFPETTTTHDGVDAAQSGALGNSQNNWIQTTVTGPGTLTFWWKVSSEAGYDFARFFINGVQQAARSGEGNWVQATYTLGAGAQTLRWDYIKDPGAIGGLDAAWVDQVNFTPGTTVRTLSVASVSPGSGVAITVSPADNNGQGNGATPFTRVYNEGTVVWLTAPTTAAGNNFQKWLKDGVDYGPCLHTNATMEADHIFTAVYVPPAVTLADALDGTGLTWTTGGNTPWFAETTTTHDGVDAAQSGALGNSQNNWIQTTVTGPGTLTFWWKVSSEAGYDYARFFINGVEQARRSGEGNWVQASYTLGAGAQTLRWDYIKDAGAIGGLDAAWVDQVSFVPGAVLTLADALDGTGLTWTTGGNTPWFAETTTTHDGVDAAQSGALGNSQNNWIQTTVTGPGTLTFWWKVSSEAGYDYARFFINGVQQAARSGEGAWVQASYTLGAGAQTLRWDYIKDPAVIGGSDAAWVDQVSFTPGTTVRTLSVASVNPGSGVAITVSPADNNGQGNGPTPFTRSYNNNTVVTLIAPTTAGGNTFQKWQKDGVDLTPSATANVTMDVSHTMTAVYQPLTLGNALDQPTWTWATGGNTPAWYGQTAVTHDGVDAARSGAIGNSQATWVETTVSGPGTVSFWWKVSSELNYDFLRFAVDGVEKASISGEAGWVQASFAVLGAGTHTLRWSYTKDAGVIAGSDAGWVDQVNFVPASGVCPNIIGNLTSAATACPGNANAVYVDTDGNGTWETLAVFHTADGEAYGDPWGYFFSAIDSHCGGAAPWPRGKIAVWFVDTTAPGFIVSNPLTWTFKSVSAVRLSVNSDLCVANGDWNTAYRSVQAYTERHQGGVLVNSYLYRAIDPDPDIQLCEFASASGIKEIYISTDFCENVIMLFEICP